MEFKVQQEKNKNKKHYESQLNFILTSSSFKNRQFSFSALFFPSKSWDGVCKV